MYFRPFDRSTPADEVLPDVVAVGRPSAGFI
jgi:hypothetical protein